MVKQAITLNPLNWQALYYQYQQASAGGSSVERFNALLALMRSNPCVPDLIIEVARELVHVLYNDLTLVVGGLELLARAKRETGMPIVSEVLDPHDVALCSKYVDILQIGARNMQNYALLREVGRSGHPVLLKRGGMYPTIENWLLCAEYILREGNRNVMLCERGLPVPGGETATRNVLDVSAVAVVHELSHLPVIVDPSHGTGRRSLVTSMALAGIAAGAHGLMVEVHAQPEVALSDGAQSLTPQAFAHLVEQVDAVAAALSRTVGVA